MRGIAKHVILRGECLSHQSEKIADCLGFGEINTLYVAVCELKNTRPDASDVEVQLNNGVKQVIKICADIAPNSQPQIFPILVAAEYPSYSELVKLNAIKIQIYGESKKIILEKRTCKFLNIIKIYATP